MKIISGGRGTGKTKKMLEMASETGGIVVCRDPADMRERAHSYGINIRQISFVPYNGLNEGIWAPIYIDNIEQYLKSQCPHLKSFTISID